MEDENVNKKFFQDFQYTFGAMPVLASLDRSDSGLVSLVVASSRLCCGFLINLHHFFSPRLMLNEKEKKLY